MFYLYTDLQMLKYFSYATSKRHYHSETEETLGGSIEIA